MAAYPADDEVFRALADPSRRRLLDRLNDRNGQTLRELTAELDMARQSVSKHLAILEAANLVTTVRRGREKLHYLNPAPISEIGERWITRYDRERVDALADLKRALEEGPMDRPSFVYTTYIRTTPEQLWQALTDPAFTQRYWNTTFDTDWQPGSPMTWNMGDGIVVADPEQVVLESEPYRRLSYTWHTFSRELNDSLDLTDAVREHIAGEGRSRATFELEPVGDQVRLTVTHEGLDPDGYVRSLIGDGWPRVLSQLKTLLETGETLPPTTEPHVAVRLGLTSS